MPDTTPRIAAAYIRVSTEEQTDQSPESQLVEIRKYAAHNNYIVPDDLVYMDEGISGKRSQNRPAFQRMIGAAKEKPAPFEVILLWKFSRFARNQEESIVYKALLRKQCGVDVISISEQLPGGPFASLIERIIEWFDEFYSIRLAQEVKRSMAVKAGKGDFQTKPPLGYCIDRTAGRKGVLKIVPEEAAIVKDIFDRYMAGEGCFTIAQSLNAQGLTTRSGKTFSNASLEYILQNPIYMGKVRWTPAGRTGKAKTSPDSLVVDGEHEPLITPEQFQAVQERMAIVKAAWGYKARPTYELKDWLSGLVRCAACGATLIHYKGRYFKCNNYVHGKCSHTQIVTDEALHEAVISQLEADLSSGSLTYTLVRKTPERSGELGRLRASLAELRRRDGRLLDAYLSGAIPLVQYTDTKAALESSIEDTEQRISILAEEETAGHDAGQLKHQIDETLKTLTSPDVDKEAKNNALRQLTERITFDRDASILEITYRLIF